MIYFALAQIFSLLLDFFALFAVPHHPDHQMDLGVLLMIRQQVRILQRHHPATPRISRWEKLTLAVLVAKLPGRGPGAKTKLNELLLLFKPDIVLRWHRESVRRKWTYTHRRDQHGKGGRLSTDPQLQALIKRLANENPTRGYSKLHGELLKLDYKIGRSTVRDILKRQHVQPAPERSKQGSSWRSFLSHYGQQFLAADFFTVETAWLQTLYVFFFVELGSRRVHFAGCTAHPTAEWVTQQAQQLAWTLKDEQDEHLPIRFLIRDRDAKFTASFDTVFAAEDVKIIRTPYKAPRANAFAER